MGSDRFYPKELSSPIHSGDRLQHARCAAAKAPVGEFAKYLTKPVLPKTLREITLEVLGLKVKAPEYLMS